MAKPDEIVASEPETEEEETMASPETVTPAGPVHPRYVVRTGDLWYGTDLDPKSPTYDNKRYVKGEEFWSDDQAVMEQLIDERVVILDAEFQGMANFSAEMAKLQRQLVDAQAKIATLENEKRQLQRGSESATRRR